MVYDATSTGRPRDEESGLARRTVALWDISQRPTTNDRRAKLGALVGTPGGVIGNYDPDAHRPSFVDGITDRPGEDEGEQNVALPGGGQFTATGPGTVSSRALAAINGGRVFEPDNWILRLHERDGRGPDSVWAVRLIADHTNATDEAKHRSTMVVDQEKEQGWAWLQNTLWLVDLGAKHVSQALEINYAGFLNMLTERGFNSPGSFGHEHALAWNVAKNAGFLTDGTQVGTVSHILRWVVSSGSQAAANTANRPTAPGMVAMNAEGPFQYDNGDTVALPRIEGAPGDIDDSGEELKKVFFTLGTPGGSNVSFAEDPNSNQPELPRGAYPSIGGFVKLNKPDDP